MRTLLTALLLASLTTAARSGPSSYEDCILESMRGVTSDEAARAIQFACREKFPVGFGATALTDTELTQIKLGNAQLANAIPVEEYSPEAVKAAQDKGSNWMEFTATNTSDNLTITQITIQVAGDDVGPSRDYTVNCNIKPRTSDRLKLEISPIHKILSWQLRGAKGTRR
jgi:hypothetical protein